MNNMITFLIAGMLTSPLYMLAASTTNIPQVTRLLADSCLSSSTILSSIQQRTKPRNARLTKSLDVARSTLLEGSMKSKKAKELFASFRKFKEIPLFMAPMQTPLSPKGCWTRLLQSSLKTLGSLLETACVDVSAGRLRGKRQSLPLHYCYRTSISVSMIQVTSCK